VKGVPAATFPHATHVAAETIIEGSHEILKRLRARQINNEFPHCRNRLKVGSMQIHVLLG
jgi:hypothetical protein